MIWVSFRMGLQCECREPVLNDLIPEIWKDKSFIIPPRWTPKGLTLSLVFTTHSGKSLDLNTKNLS